LIEKTAIEAVSGNNMSISHNKDIKSPELEASIVEPLLTICIEGLSIFEISWKIQTIMLLPYFIIKRYLFYLIDYEVMRYDGQKQIFTTTYEGHNLLDMIDKEKKQENNNINDITITFECEQT
jgi:predicted transcriptional regulator